jgi:cation transport regulator
MDVDSALPERVRRLPRQAQDIYRAAFTDAFERYGREREAIAHRIAWSTVKRHFVQRSSGEWEPREPHA